MPKSTPRNDIYDVMNDGVMENIKYGKPEEMLVSMALEVIDGNNNSYGKL